MLYSKIEEISTKVEVLENILIEKYFYTNADKSKKYIDEKVLKISDSLENAEGKILGNLNLGYY